MSVNSMERLIAPSLLAADFNNLGACVQMINDSEADWIHCDVMDGVFVPNISFGLPIIEHVAKITAKPLDVHLMIADPDKYIDKFARAGASIITVHWETCPHLHRTVSLIREAGLMASVCLNPHSPVQMLENILPHIGMVLLMSVNPGFGGQEFIEETFVKIDTLKEMILRKNPECLIEVDGGINFETGSRLFAAGVNVLVAGSFVFSSQNPAETISRLKKG